MPSARYRIAYQDERLRQIEAASGSTADLTAGYLLKASGSATPAVSIVYETASKIGIGTTSPSVALDVNSDAFRVRTAKTPASAAATGAAGTICWDADYVYVCTATNTWKRAAIATW
jgi:hypothetical protein